MKVIHAEHHDGQSIPIEWADFMDLVSVQLIALIFHCTWIGGNEWAHIVLVSVRRVAQVFVELHSGHSDLGPLVSVAKR